MTSFQQLDRKISSSVYYNKMLKKVRLLEDFLGVNHFFYYRITDSGHYCYVGSHSLWNEFFFSNAEVISNFAYLRHPDILPEGISIMKNVSHAPYKEVLNIASAQFGINFNIFLLNKIPGGIEGYGLGTHDKLHLKDEFLLNELPRLNQFYKQFREENKNLFNILYDNQIDLASHIGSTFYEATMEIDQIKNRNKFLSKIGFQDILTLSHQERQVFMALANGFPAQHIAKKLFLSKRTIEHYIENIKNKLTIDSRVELIEKAKEFVAIDRSPLDF